jgi:DNA-binding NtrC family response regulator
MAIHSASPPGEVREREAPPVHVLVVDDEEPIRRALARLLTARGFRVDVAVDGPAALDFLEKHDPDVLLSDLQMPGMSGIDLLKRAKAIHPSLVVVIMTAFADVDAAVGALRSGAYHFLAKPLLSTDAVALTITSAAEHRHLLDHARALERRLVTEGKFGEIIGDAPKMRALYRLIDEVAPTSSTVLVLGESGTGKELVARAIHARSPRVARPFVAVNCGAIAPEMIESEMFGHVKGAFTGAHGSRAGLFASAQGGTLFLDEVGDLPLAAQVKLLRALQEREIKAVGSDEVRVVDVRVVAATNVDLAARVEAGAFRRDLYYRLAVFTLELPPLRERPDDAALLAAYFARKIAQRIGKKDRRLSPDAVAAIRAHPWPGNVRELENAMERACIVARGEEIHAADFPFTRAFAATEPTTASGAAPRDSDLFELPFAEAKRRVQERFENDYVRALTARSGGNTNEAARLAGVDRSNFRRIQRRLGRST